MYTNSMTQSTCNVTHIKIYTEHKEYNNFQIQTNQCELNAVYYIHQTELHKRCYTHYAMFL